jgi:hypothetical protein
MISHMIEPDTNFRKESLAVGKMKVVSKIFTRLFLK